MNNYANAREAAHNAERCWQRENGLIKGRWHQRRQPLVTAAATTFGREKPESRRSRRSHFLPVVEALAVI